MSEYTEEDLQQFRSISKDLTLAARRINRMFEVAMISEELRETMGNRIEDLLDEVCDDLLERQRISGQRKLVAASRKITLRLDQ